MFSILQTFFLLRRKCSDLRESCLYTAKSLQKKTLTRKIATFHRHFMRSESETCVEMYRPFK